MTVRIPEPNSIPAEQFCHDINPSSQPEYIAITPEPGCEPNDCFKCVQRKVEQAGGRIQYGWVIWECPGVYIEAEHHAVWEPSPGAPLIDITPAEDLDTRRYFVRDDAAVYDFENEGSRRDNRRRALNDDPLVEQFLRTAEARVAILKSIPGIGQIEVDDETATRFEEVESESARLYWLLAMKYTLQSAPCPCGSGVKFKRCHGDPKMQVR